MRQYEDVRQSDNWGKYLEFLGWNIYKTSRGINIANRRLFFGSLVKIQRPIILKKDDLDEIEKICRENKALFIKMEPNFAQDTKIIEEAGYEPSTVPLIPPKTIFIHLDKSEEALWKDVSRSGKYGVNRARREGARVEFFKNPSEDILKEYYPVLKYTGKTKKFYTQPFKDLQAKVKIFGDGANIALVYSGDGTLAGGKLFLTHKDSVLYVHGGTSAEGRKNRAGYLLYWDPILYFKKLGFKLFDLEGVDDERFPSFTRDWGGFAHFKEKFGGETVTFPYPHIKYLSPAFKAFAKLSPLGF